MSSVFPTAIDTFTNPSPTTLMDASGPLAHSSQHININDSVTSIENTIGITNSTNPASLTYKVNRLTETQLISSNIPAGDILTIGNPVYINASGVIKLGSYTNSTTSGCIGVSLANTLIGNASTVANNTSVTQPDWTAITGSSTLTSGSIYYLAASGQLSTSAPPTNTYLLEVGIAISSTSLYVSINPSNRILL